MSEASEVWGSLTSKTDDIPSLNLTGMLAVLCTSCGEVGRGASGGRWWRVRGGGGGGGAAARRSDLHTCDGDRLVMG